MTDKQTNQTDQSPTIKISDVNVEAKNVSDLIKSETTLLENKYFRWVISFGLAFLLLKTIDTAIEVSYIRGQQESFDKTITTLFDSRDELIKNLKNENGELRRRTIELDSLRLANEKLRFETERIKSTIETK